MSEKIQYVNPEGLSKNPAFSQIVTTQGLGKTIYIGGQNAVNSNEDIKLTIYIVQGQDLADGFKVSQKYLGRLKNPPVVSVLVVAGLANPDFLVEINATAFIPE